MPVSRATRALRSVALAAPILVLIVAAPGFLPSARAGTAHTVQITGFAFAPDDMTVAVGDTVTWTNLDPVVHTATSTSGAFDSGDLGPNESFSLTFTAPGTYDYLCTPHPSMTGRIVVAAPAPTAAQAAPGGSAGIPNVAMPGPGSPTRPGQLAGLVLLLAALMVAWREAAPRRSRD